MQPDDPIIREFLAAALRGEPKVWPEAWDSVEAADSVARGAIFHGIAGLLVEESEARVAWPETLGSQLRQAAVAQAMWELRHRQLLSDLLNALHERGIPCLLMKGSAVAYALYENPYARSRGDTDILIHVDDVSKAASCLAELGYRPLATGGVALKSALQQSWEHRSADGGSHVIDLHWHAINAPSLSDLFPFVECYSDAEALPRLSIHSKGMDRVRLLIHTCVHRALQCNAAYRVDGITYFEPGRLIWSNDIGVLANSLSGAEWDTLCASARAMGVARACVDGLESARTALGTKMPQDVRQSLELASKNDRKNSYLIRSNALSRARQDIAAIPGLNAKLIYALSRILPGEEFIRWKYPELAGKSLPRLYGRRLADLLLRRGRAS